ncbi:hypothetical protein BDV95DRAFT_612027 [Massariosphaeria phaeospora]|uniref:Uncharacterized protein n=1 Tax=Massariosphaeria phaeospora TaxID=100035 RepID=A0A7C8M2E3_9PLEO|nr:hypothetical protein BDV95DRAFT_612027 [Massariosphaeria phaeospora]
MSYSTSTSGTNAVENIHEPDAALAPVNEESQDALEENDEPNLHSDPPPLRRSRQTPRKFLKAHVISFTTGLTKKMNQLPSAARYKNKIRLLSHLSYAELRKHGIWNHVETEKDGGEYLDIYANPMPPETQLALRYQEPEQTLKVKEIIRVYA